MKKVILMVMAVAAICSCGAGKKNDVAKALVGDWEIVEAGGAAVEAGFEKPTISFDDKGGVHGNTSINGFFGNYKVEGDAIKFGEMGVTKMMGPTPEVETAVLEGLDSAAKVEFADNDNASVLSKDGKTVLKLKRTELSENGQEEAAAEESAENAE